MKIALAQMNVLPGQPRKNLEKMLEMIERAKAEKADLVAFPEMCIGGYLLGDAWTDEAWCRDLMAYGEEVRKASHGIAVAFGNVYMEEEHAHPGFHPNMDGRLRKYNAVYVAQNGKWVRRKDEPAVLPRGVQPKTLLPTYRIFDDKRYFTSTLDIATDFGVPLESLLQPFMIHVDGHEVPIGFEVCEDLWCEDYRKKGRAMNPTRTLINNGAEMIVNISASPWTYGKNGARDRRIEFLMKDCERFVPFYYVNCTGAQNNGKNIVTFDGGSTVYDAKGNPIRFSTAPYEEELMIIDRFDGAALKREEEPKIKQKIDAIVRGIRHMPEIRGMDGPAKYVIGLSGGVDSAVVASLLTLAVGKDRVLAVNMPTRYNSEKTKGAAASVAEALDIPYIEIPIEPIVSQIKSTLLATNPNPKVQLSSLAEENIQAKVRGTDILSNIAAMHGAYFTNNGNKLEIALGYATLYGDVGGAVSVIGDLTKTEVFDVARYLNEHVFHREVIPELLIPDTLFRFRKDQIQPSAELKENQVDPMKFGYHDAMLEAMMDYKKKTPADFMQWYREGTLHTHLGIDFALMQRYGLEDPKTFVDDLEWFTKLFRQSVFKRVQAPPIIITSKTAFGYDLRESQLPYTQSPRYEQLRREVLQLPRYEPRR